MKIKFPATVILALVMLLSFTGTAFAADPCERVDPTAPPQLDEQQAQLWLNTSRIGRSYLARLWNIDMRAAEHHGMLYPEGSYRWDMHSGPWDCHSSRFGVEIFMPIPIVFPELPESKPTVIKYDAPPSLDTVQQTRWGQALPSARKYLAKIYGISDAEAMKYGASEE